MNASPRILCVDDEPSILHGLTLHLQNAFEITTATDGIAGLQAIRNQGPFAAVLSDMSMPHLDGATFLGRVRKESPETVRLLFTGERDLGAAVTAINEGQPFRVLVKPCSPQQLELTLEAAVEQHRLRASDTDLSEQSIHTSIQTLGEVLVLAHPVVFGRPNRLRRHVRALAQKLTLSNQWQIEVAAMLSQIGSLTLPMETANKLYQGLDLEQKELSMVSSLPEVARRLLGNIPGLEPVLEILVYEQIPLKKMAKNSGRAVPIGALLLRIVSDFDILETRGLSPRNALSKMEGWKSFYDPEILAAFTEHIDRLGACREVSEIPIEEVRAGMVVAEDFTLKTGVLLAPRGYEISVTFVERVMNLEKRVVRDPVKVILPDR